MEQTRIPRIGIIGMGHVGSRLAVALATRCELVTYDNARGGDYPENELASCCFTMICVNTPTRPDGSVDIDHVIQAIDQVPTDAILLRSTVPPGTTDAIRERTGKVICFAPEYVGESTFVASNWNGFDAAASFMILGGPPEDRRQFVDVLEYIYGPQLIILQMGASEAELVKYMENSYFAVKMMFVHEFRQVAECLGLDWHVVREGWLLDPRVDRDHSSDFASEPGYAGKCIPKDVKGILHFSEAIGINMPVLRSADRANGILRQ